MNFEGVNISPIHFIPTQQILQMSNDNDQTGSSESDPSGSWYKHYLYYSDWTHVCTLRLSTQERRLLLDQLDLQFFICRVVTEETSSLRKSPNICKTMRIKCSFTVIIINIGKDSGLRVELWKLFFRKHVGCDHLKRRKSSLTG